MSEDRNNDISGLVQSVRVVAQGADRFRRLVAERNGLGITELQALGHLHPSTSLQPGRLGALLGITTGTMTPLLDRLEAGGYLTRSRHPTDRRSIVVSLTPKGAAVVAHSYDVVVSEMQRAIGVLQREGTLDGIALDKLATVLSRFGNTLAAIDVAAID